MGMPTRIDDDLYSAAKAVGERHSRSAAQQLGHWARIGRELEASSATTHRDIDRVLSGVAAYDDLPDESQAVVRATWDERIGQTLAGLNFEAALRGAAEPWAEADDEGALVMRDVDDRA